jgi:hypothetical protein
MKICTKCGINKPLKDFGPLKRSPDGLYPSCRACERVRKNAWKDLNRDHVNWKGRQYYHDNIEAERERGRVKYHLDPLKSEKRRARYELYGAEQRAQARANRNEHRRRIERRSRQKNYLRVLEATKERQRQLRRATPRWLTEDHRAAIRALYEEAAFLTTLTGVPHHVDHIHPLRGVDASGLHVPWNLQVLSMAENIAKGNVRTG